MEYRISNGDDVFTLEEFIDCVNSGLFVDCDGSGYYALLPNYYYDKPARPSKIHKGEIDYNYTHVVWFNK